MRTRKRSGKLGSETRTCWPRIRRFGAVTWSPVSSAAWAISSDEWTIAIIMYKLDQQPLLFESSRPGRGTAILPDSDVPDRPLSELIPDGHRAPAPVPLPELAELDVVRHYTNLSTLNMSIDSNFYPLGSCTM